MIQNVVHVNMICFRGMQTTRPEMNVALSVMATKNIGIEFEVVTAEL